MLQILHQYSKFNFDEVIWYQMILYLTMPIFIFNSQFENYSISPFRAFSKLIYLCMRRFICLWKFELRYKLHYYCLRFGRRIMLAISSFRIPFISFFRYLVSPWFSLVKFMWKKYRKCSTLRQSWNKIPTLLWNTDVIICWKNVIFKAAVEKLESWVQKNCSAIWELSVWTRFRKWNRRVAI